MRLLGLIVLLIGAYCVDITYCNGRWSGKAELMARNFGAHVNQQARHLLKPLGI